MSFMNVMAPCFPFTKNWFGCHDEKLVLIDKRAVHNNHSQVMLIAYQWSLGRKEVIQISFAQHEHETTTCKHVIFNVVLIEISCLKKVRCFFINPSSHGIFTVFGLLDFHVQYSNQRHLRVKGKVATFTGCVKLRKKKSQFILHKIMVCNGIFS